MNRNDVGTLNQCVMSIKHNTWHSCEAFKCFTMCIVLKVSKSYYHAPKVEIWCLVIATMTTKAVESSTIESSILALPKKIKKGIPLPGGIWPMKSIRVTIPVNHNTLTTHYINSTW